MTIYELSRQIQCELGGFNASYISLKHVMHTNENIESNNPSSFCR